MIAMIGLILLAAEHPYVFFILILLFGVLYEFKITALTFLSNTKKILASYYKKCQRKRDK